MTVATETFWSNIYTGDGSEDTFDFSFPITNTNQVIPLLDGVVGTNYSVTLNDSEDLTAGGSVVFDATYEPDVGVEVLIIRRLSYLQSTDPLTTYNAATVEAGLDALDMQIQQVAKRALQIKDYELADSVSPLLPAIGDATAGDALVVNNAKTGFIFGTGMTGAAISSAMAPVVEAATLDLAASAFSFKATGGSTARSLADWLTPFGDHPSASVQSTGIPGIDGSPFMIYKAYTTAPGGAGHSEISVARAQRHANYTGGTPGNVENTIWALHQVEAGVTNFEWTILAVQNNYATAGENVAIYGQINVYGGGRSWAGTFEARDYSGNADPANGLVGVEIDVFANGTDASRNRVGIDMVVGKGIAGTAPDVGHGIRLGPSNGLAANGSFINGITLSKTFVRGIDLSDADCSVADIVTKGKVGIGTAAPSVMLDVVGTGDTQIRAYDEASVDLRMNAVAASGAGVIGTYSAHDLVLYRNGAEAARFDASHNLGVGTAAPDRRFHAELDDATTNGVSNVGRFTHTSSGVVANGFGLGVEFELETATGGTNKVIGSQEYVFQTATAGAEDAALLLKLAKAGTLTQVARFNGSSGFAGLGDTAFSPAVSLDVRSSGADVALRAFANGTVDGRLYSSTASSVTFVGTYSNHDVILVRNGASLLRLEAAALYPSTNDGVALGKAGNAFSDADFANGAVIRFNNAYTITHSTGALAFAGGSVSLYIPSFTATNIADKTNAVNTANKAQGKIVYDTTNHRIMVADGATDVSVWYVADASASVTPA